MQKLLADHPSLLAGNQMNPRAPRKWLLVSRETPLSSTQGGAGRWSVDHLFLDQDAVPTIVEVKRSSDTRIRREVVGQLLEYAANAVVYWPVESLISQFESTQTAQGQDPSEILAEFLGENEDANTFWGRVKTNLQAGKIRLVFVADYIPPELQRIVEFLNGQMSSAEVLAVQIKQYVGEGFKTLIPRVIGQTAQAQQAKTVGPKSTIEWDEDSFFQLVEKRVGAQDVVTAKQILEWAKAANLIITWGKGATDPGFRIKVDHDDLEHAIAGIWSYGAGQVTNLEILYDQLNANQHDTNTKRLEFLRQLGAIPGVGSYLGGTKIRPNIPLSLFHRQGSLDQLLKALNWAVQTMKSAVDQPTSTEN